MKKKDKLDGFKDFIKSHKIHIHRKPLHDKNDQGIIQSFLENNFMRLSKTSELFHKKIPSLENYETAEKEIERLLSENKKIKDSIVRSLEKKDSPLHQSIGHIFDSFFF
jgi:DNA mismatch repair ATPase MutS